MCEGNLVSDIDSMEEFLMKKVIHGNCPLDVIGSGVGRVLLLEETNDVDSATVNISLMNCLWMYSIVAAGVVAVLKSMTNFCSTFTSTAGVVWLASLSSPFPFPLSL